MIPMTPGETRTWFRFWWKQGNRTKYAYGCEGDEYPGDWVGTREAAQKMRDRWVTLKAVEEDAEWGIEEAEMTTHAVETSEDNVVVVLDEEYGYREWLWATGMSAEALKQWWTDLASVRPHFMDPSTTLPGSLVQIMRVGDGEACIEGETDHTYITFPSGWRGHIHLDDDSFLNTPGGRLLHKGHTEGV